MFIEIERIKFLPIILTILFALFPQGFAYFWNWYDQYGDSNCTIAHNNIYQDEITRVKNICMNIPTRKESNNGTSTSSSLSSILSFRCLSKCMVEHLNQTKSDRRWDVDKFTTFEAQSNATHKYLEKLGTIAHICDKMAVERLKIEGGFDRNLCTYHDTIDFCLYSERRKIRKEMTKSGKLSCL